MSPTHECSLYFYRHMQEYFISSVDQNHVQLQSCLAAYGDRNFRVLISIFDSFQDGKTCQKFHFTFPNLRRLQHRIWISCIVPQLCLIENMVNIVMQLVTTVTSAFSTTNASSGLQNLATKPTQKVDRSSLNFVLMTSKMVLKGCISSVNFNIKLFQFSLRG